MPNSTVPYVRSMTPAATGDTPIEVYSVDEYVHTDLKYMSLLQKKEGTRTLLALVGVQSHQFHRALDLAAFAVENQCMAIIGGPHVMTCDTSLFHGSGVSFALSEAELVWPQILKDAAYGELQPVYGSEQRWQKELDAPVIIPPIQKDLGRYIVPMLGLYPARGCPFLCNFCSVTKIAGRKIRSQSISTTMESLRAAKAAGVRTVMFTSDNFNKYPEAEDLLSAMIDESIGLKFFVQCDTQIAKQEAMVELLGRAGCFQMFVGVESFNRQTLLAARKGQNRPETFRDIVRLCNAHGIGSHFSNIIGFPQDTEQGIREHLTLLQEMAPTLASFYILCPIPGTEQYDEFLAADLICERNLDRFDTSCLTWRHPELTPAQLSKLLFDCYRDFFSISHSLKGERLPFTTKSNGSTKSSMGNLAMSAFIRYCAWRQMHPMSGGMGRVKRSGDQEKLSLRDKRFGVYLAPLPLSLKLPEVDRKPQPQPPATKAAERLPIAVNV